MSRLVCGVGINDANYTVQIKETTSLTKDGKRVQRSVWLCPFYSRWNNILNRCYNKKSLVKRPSYKDCFIVPEWHYFMTFRAWMEKQDWQGREIDKDLLFRGNKVYGPDTCLFLDQKVNSFITESTATRGEWPIGVYFHKGTKKFTARCGDFTDGKQKSLGYFNEPQEAHKAWLNFKLEQAYLLASEQTDPRVAKALISRYENYQEV